MNTNEPVTILVREDKFQFAGVAFTVDEVFQTVLRR
jgi:hypothetical protein